MAGLVLLDSGAAVSACPQSYCSEVPMTTSPMRLQLRAANGEHVPHHGRRVVTRLAGRSVYSVGFEVADVAGPIVALSALEEGGWRWGGHEAKYHSGFARCLVRGSDETGEYIEIVCLNGVYWLRLDDAGEDPPCGWLCPLAQRMPGEEPGEKPRAARSKKVQTLPDEETRRSHECTHVPA